MSNEDRYWPHAPLHRLSDTGTYIVSAGTFGKRHYFRQADRLDVLERGLLKVAAHYEWRLEAWAVFSNHYHFVGHASAANDLSEMLGHLHSRLGEWVNRLDGTRGRRVWHNFWETRLTFEKSYLARLNYVHQNPVKHGLVDVANKYQWCSASWYERLASPSQSRTLQRFRTDRVNIYDEFEPVLDL